MNIKYPGSTREKYSKLDNWRYAGEDGTHGVAVICVDIVWNAKGENSLLGIT